MKMYLRKHPFALFLWYIAGKDMKRLKAFVTSIGFLLHRHQIASKMLAVILLDQSINELGIISGGKGKTLLGKALSHMRNVCEISGKDFISSSQFAFQRVSSLTNIICINDIKKNLGFEVFFGRTSDGFTVNRKYEKEEFIEPQNAPKLLLTSNYVMKRPDGYSSKRRMRELELSDHFGENLTVQQEFGHHFFEEWTSKTWSGFHLLMAFCISYYLKHGLSEVPEVNLKRRRLIVEIGLELIDFLTEKFDTKSKHHKKELFKEFITGGYVESRYKPTLRTFTVKLKKYLEYQGYNYHEIPSNTKAYIEIITEEDPIHFITIDDVDTNYRTVDTANKMTRMVNTMSKHFSNENSRVLALDFETTGLDVHTDNTVSLALSFKPKTGFNIMLPRNASKRNTLLEPLLPFLDDSSITKVMHNAKFDLKFFDKLGISLGGEIHDTMIMDYLFNPTIKSHGLKQICKRHLNYQMIDFKQMTTGKLITEVDTESLTDYAVEDADITLQLHQLLTNKLK